MIKRVWLIARTNYGVIVVTFELFWILVFLLDKAGQGGAGGVPAFVYVNF